MDSPVNLPDILHALQQVQEQIRWKPGKAHEHLNKRRNRGHLLPQTTLTEYEAIIQAVVQHPHAFVYVYRYGILDYPSIVAPYQEQTWLVMFGLDGIMETAFPPDQPDTYFVADPRYTAIGYVKELME